MFNTLPFLRFAAGLAALTLATACSSSNNNPTPSTASGMSWTINGTNMTALSTRVITQESYLPNGYIELAGSFTNSTASNAVDLILPKAVGTYSFSSVDPNGTRAGYVVASLSGGTSSGMFGDTGTITVTSLTATKIVGTFSYSGTASGTSAPVQQSITNGKFNIAL